MHHLTVFDHAKKIMNAEASVLMQRNKVQSSVWGFARPERA